GAGQVQLSSARAGAEAGDAEDALAADQVCVDVAHAQSLGVVAQFAMGNVDGAADIRGACRARHGDVEAERPAGVLGTCLEHGIYQSSLEGAADPEVHCALGGQWRTACDLEP